MAEIKQRKLFFKILILWFMILILASFAASVQSRSDPVAIQVIPDVPREDRPIIATFYLNNPSAKAMSTDYSFYANGELVMSGRTELAPGGGRQFRYAYSNPLKLGDQVTFVAKTQSEEGEYEKSTSVPGYPPTVWSSFVSFASFSTSAMSSMSFNSMAYYDNSFGTNKATMNAGLIISVVLIIMLIYMELSEPLIAENKMHVMGKLRIRLGRLSSVLFIIFLGMVFTQIALILGGMR